MEPDPDWDGRKFCNQCGRCERDQLVWKCRQCGNNEFSLKENPTYAGWLRRNPVRQLELFKEVQ